MCCFSIESAPDNQFELFQKKSDYRLPLYLLSPYRLSLQAKAVKYYLLKCNISSKKLVIVSKWFVQRYSRLYLFLNKQKCLILSWQPFITCELKLKLLKLEDNN